MFTNCHTSSFLPHRYLVNLQYKQRDIKYKLNTLKSKLMGYLFQILVILLFTVLIRTTVKEIKKHISKEADRIIKKIDDSKSN